MKYFAIDKVVLTNPVTYKLKDYRNELLVGGFYEQELSKTETKDVYLIEKVLKTKGNKCYVKWLGFDNNHNSWVSVQDVLVKS